MGMSTPEWARYLREDLGVDLPPEQIAAAVVDRMAARYARQLPLMPDATNTLGRVGQRWRLALANSSPRALIDTVLATAGWTWLFDVTISTEEVGSGKPAPDVYLATVERLKVTARSAVAIEDSAGLRLIAVPRPSYPPAADALNGADLVLTRLSDLSVAAIESLS